MQTFLLTLLKFIVNRLADPTFRSSATAEADVVELATDNTCPGERGYLVLLNKDHTDPVTMEKKIRDTSLLRWAKFTKEDTTLKGSIGGWATALTDLY